jgi:hypothetical protein
MSDEWVGWLLAGAAGVAVGLTIGKRGTEAPAAEDAASPVSAPPKDSIVHLQKPLSSYLPLAKNDRAFATWLKRVDDEVLLWTMGQGVSDLYPRSWQAEYRKGSEPYAAVGKLVGNPEEPGKMLMAELAFHRK